MRGGMDGQKCATTVMKCLKNFPASFVVFLFPARPMSLLHLLNCDVPKELPAAGGLYHHLVL